MEEHVCDFIYSIKLNWYKKVTLKERAVAFLSDYSGIPIQEYDEESLYRCIMGYFLDFIESTNNPIFYMRQYFECKFPRRASPYDDIEAMLTVMQMSQVKNSEGEFINGFKGTPRYYDMV